MSSSSELVAKMASHFFRSKPPYRVFLTTALGGGPSVAGRDGGGALAGAGSDGAAQDHSFFSGAENAKAWKGRGAALTDCAPAGAGEKTAGTGAGGGAAGAGAGARTSE